MGWCSFFSRLASPQVGSAWGREAGRREGPARLRFFAAAGLVATLLPLTSCGANPPQIVDYAPQRGSIDVSTAAPIRISFDHDVDQASVESRLHMQPVTSGTVRWVSRKQLIYEHPTLHPNTAYEVILEAGYRDPAGVTYTLRHRWSFVTEGPPSLVSTTPANADGGVDPAGYLILDFTREMDPSSIQSALTFSPAVPFEAQLDPTDIRRVVVAPSELLAPNTSYKVAVSTGAIDLDGNQLDRNQAITFHTGPVRPLRHWITFATNGLDGSSAGLWIVNETGFPRLLFGSSAVRSFSWSPAGDSLLVQGDDETWSVLAPGTTPVPLTFKGPWAAPLASGMGYLYVDDSGALHRQTRDGVETTIATDVAQASVSPEGLRVAFIRSVDSNQIWGYDVALRARYQLALDTAPVTNVAWAPTGNRIAYLRLDTGTIRLRVRNLTGPAGTTTVASGDLGAPAWLPDSTHIVIAALIQATVAGQLHKAFVINVVSPPAALNAASGLPSDPSVDVISPIASPDGHQIAFLNANQVWLMNADGTRPTALTRLDRTSFPYSCRTPDWTRS